MWAFSVGIKPYKGGPTQDKIYDMGKRGTIKKGAG